MQSMTNAGTREVERITFLVHPYCYAKSLRKVVTMPHDQWLARHRLEKVVAKRWYEAIDRMGDADAIVYHPCYQSDEEKALAEHGRKRLGDRFLELAGRDISKPEGATPETLSALAPDIGEAFRVRGKYEWPAHDLRIAVFSYNYAHDIIAAFAERGLHFDPERVRLQAFGESFEGCAHTWTSMVPPYLGVASRVRMPFEMSVPDADCLVNSRYLRRIELPYDVAVYLFLDSDDVPFAYYHRERIRLADPTFYARLPLDASTVVVRNCRGDMLYPGEGQLGLTAPADTVRSTADGLEIAVKARNRGTGSHETMMAISAPGVSADEFFGAAEGAVIVPAGEGS
jgi:hypothetical protein